jgi:ribosome-binding protein aMBF1 (putative translation factor)
MPFKKINIKDIIGHELQTDPEFKTTWDESRMEYNLLGELIKARKAKGLSQSDIAKLIGKKQQVISRIESRESSPTLKTFCKIAENLDCEIRLVSKK